MGSAAARRGSEASIFAQLFCGQTPGGTHAPRQGGAGALATAVGSGFTLVELLVVVAAIAILASLLMPALSRAQARAKSIQCLNQLRQIGLSVLLYADENEAKVALQFQEDPERTWASALSADQSLRPLTIFLCPGYPPHKFEDWRRTFGVRLDPPAEASSGEDDEILHLSRIERPCSYLHLADTTSRGRGGLQAEQYFYFRVLSDHEVHARHLGAANGFFLDGHACSNRRKQLEDIGIRGLFERDRVPGYF